MEQASSLLMAMEPKPLRPTTIADETSALQTASTTCSARVPAGDEMLRWLNNAMAIAMFFATLAPFR